MAGDTEMTTGSETIPDHVAAPESTRAPKSGPAREGGSASAGEAPSARGTAIAGQATNEGQAVHEGRGAYEGRVVVRLEAVSKRYGDTLALDGVSLEIRAGEAVAVMGPSGCGKSTLLNMIAGLDRPDGGTVTVRGEDLGRLDETGLALFRRRGIGMIFQFFNLLDDLTALDNVALAAQLTGTPAAQARRRGLELLEELGIASRAHLYPAVLSGGERQRVAVARALMNRPAVLLADEPTGALDSHTGEQVMDLLLDLHQIGQTLLLVTHDLRLAERCASRVVELADGRVTGERDLEWTT